VILSEVYETQEELNKAEINKIIELDSVNNGYNLTYGGEGGSPSEETRLKISNKLKGVPLSDERRQHMSESQLKANHHMSEFNKKRLADANKGRVLSYEQKKKLSEAHKGKLLSEETKLKMSISHKDIIISAEQRKIISETQKGRTRSVEYRKKISDSKVSPIIIYDTITETDRIYKSVSEFCEEFNLSKVNIYRAKDKSQIVLKRYYVESI